MNAKKFFTLALLPICFLNFTGLRLSAAAAPDIVWMTNAHFQPISAVALSSDGNSVASSGLLGGLYGYVDFRRTADAELVKAFPFLQEDILALAISPDGDYLAIGGGGGGESVGKFKVWQFSANKWSYFRYAAQGEYVSMLSFSPDGLLIGLGTDASHFSMYNVTGPTNGNFDDSPHTGRLTAFAFSPASKTLATTGSEGMAKLWDYTNVLSDSSFLKAYGGHTAAINSVQFTSDGLELITASSDTTILIQRVDTGEVRLTLHDEGPVNKIAVSSDGRTLLSAGSKIKFWRLSDGLLLRTFDAETVGVSALDISKDGRFFAYGRQDGTVVLARMPLWITDVIRNDGQLITHWQGGSGLYQLQSRPSLTSGEWQNVGTPTTATSATNTVAGTVFYRVQSLPNP